MSDTPLTRNQINFNRIQELAKQYFKDQLETYSSGSVVKIYAADFQTLFDFIKTTKWDFECIKIRPGNSYEFIEIAFISGFSLTWKDVLNHPNVEVDYSDQSFIKLQEHVAKLARQLDYPYFKLGDYVFQTADPFIAPICLASEVK